MSPFRRYWLSNCAWPWHSPLEWSKVKCKYDIRKSIYKFLFIIDSNLYHICRRLRNNRIWIFEIFPTSIFDLEIQVQGHEHTLSDYILDAKLIRLQFGEQTAVLSQTVFCVWSASELYKLHYIGTPVLNIGKIWIFFTWKSPSRSQMLIFKITKAHNGYKTEQNEPMFALIGRLVWARKNVLKNNQTT